MYKSHGKVIDINECKNILKLNVKEIDKNSELWDKIWELYCRSIFFMQQRQSEGAAKLFENERVSLSFNMLIQQVPSIQQLPPRIPPQIVPRKPPEPPSPKEASLS